MARTVVTPLAGVANGSVFVAPVTIDAVLVANGVTVNAARPEQLVLRVNNTAVAAKNVTIKAGDKPPAMAAGQGDLVVAVVNATTRDIGPFESGRFLKVADDTGLVRTGSLFVDFEAGTTGTLEVLQVPAAT